MKLFLLLLLLPMAALSQDSTVSRSLFENFQSDPERIYKTESALIGKAGTVNVALAKVTDLQTGKSMKAISVYQLSAYNASSIYIDMEDLPGLTRALNLFKDEIDKGKPKFQPSFFFITNNDIVASCSYLEMGMLSGWSVSISKRYHYLKTQVPYGFLTVRNRDVDDFVSLINQAANSNAL